MSRGVSIGESRYVSVAFPERQLSLLEQLRVDAGLLDWSDAKAVRFILQYFYSSGLTIRKLLLEDGRLDAFAMLGKEIPTD
ncbi:hypothetical protein [uncultured Pseudoflavonifractor sp.]|uniref:hypothetical protein n=1 Tax=uncultured Pseudoflavonifractor sp. TaxID=1221379 RepID=UPI0025F3561E|nr:hypothetical protein [uncultured Pseudoflavonifractor sp.]